MIFTILGARYTKIHNMMANYRKRISMIDRGYDAVVVGDSTGGLEALKRILPGLPENFNMPMFIVCHIQFETATDVYGEKLIGIMDCAELAAGDGMKNRRCS